MFLIVEEKLASVVRLVESKGLVEIRVGQKKILVSMFQFANNTIFVCKVKTQNIMVIKSMLKRFEIAFSLKVSFKKWKI